MYEWEGSVDRVAIENRKDWLRKEIKRINETTLRGNFVKEEDRDYWKQKAKTLNSQLMALEEMK